MPEKPLAEELDQINDEEIQTYCLLCATSGGIPVRYAHDCFYFMLSVDQAVALFKSGIPRTVVRTARQGRAMPVYLIYRVWELHKPNRLAAIAELTEIHEAGDYEPDTQDFFEERIRLGWVRKPPCKEE